MRNDDDMARKAIHDIVEKVPELLTNGQNLKDLTAKEKELNDLNKKEAISLFLAVLAIGRGKRINIMKLTKGLSEVSASRAVELYNIGQNSATALGIIMDQLNISGKKKLFLELFYLVFGRETRLKEFAIALTVPQEYSQVLIALINLHVYASKVRILLILVQSNLGFIPVCS
jgi:hypothetical protein